MRLRFVFITSIFLGFIGVLKGQDTTVNITHFEIISSDSVILEEYNWSMCIVNKSDTIIVLTDKGIFFNCIKNPVIKLERIYSIKDIVTFRLNTNDIYINDVLCFPKGVEVYLYNY